MKLNWARAEEIVNSGEPPYVFATRQSQEHPIHLLNKRHRDDDRGIITSGRQMRDWDELSATLSHIFSFPTYYGQNWDALYDCLTDLSWFPFKKLLLVVTKGEEVLIRQPSEFEVLVNVLNDASRFWCDPSASRPFGPKDEPRLFHTVFVLPDNYGGARGLELLRD